MYEYIYIYIHTYISPQQQELRLQQGAAAPLHRQQRRDLAKYVVVCSVYRHTYRWIDIDKCSVSFQDVDSNFGISNLHNLSLSVYIYIYTCRYMYICIYRETHIYYSIINIMQYKQLWVALLV